MASVWDSVVGQDRAVEQLQHATVSPVHAYLFVGIEGSGKEEASRAFAATLITGSDDPTVLINEMVMREAHFDVHEVRRVGASILKPQAEEIIRLAAITPTEGSRKVIIVHEVHLMAPITAAMLLKTVEEPPSGVFFILLADQVDDSLATIASRCLTVHFGLLENSVIETALLNSGIAPSLAHAAAISAAGSLTRATLLASDPQLAQRREFFANIPRRIDGTGATVIAIIEQILALIEDALEPLRNQHAQEIIDTEKTLAVMGVKRGGKKMLEERHGREIRRYRTDELRSGMTAIASIYRDELARNPNIHRPEAYITAITRLHEGMRRLSLNVNEAILLRDLIWSLPSPSADAALQFVLSEKPE